MTDFTGFKGGGYCIGSTENISELLNHIECTKGAKFLVVSAPEGVTDILKKGIDEQLAFDTENLVRPFPMERKIKLMEIFNDRFGGLSGSNELLKNAKDDLDERISKYKESKLEWYGADVLAWGDHWSPFGVALQFSEWGFPSRGIDPKKLITLIGSNPLDALYDRSSDKKIIKEVNDQSTLPIIGGFEGIGHDGRTMVLGRSGSDTTATVIARAIGAKISKNIKNVPGVLAVDPRAFTKEDWLKINEKAKYDPVLIDRINDGGHPLTEETYLSYHVMQRLATLGAKLLHARAVEPLIENKSLLHFVELYGDGTPGTTIGPQIDDECRVVGITGKKNSQTIVTIENGEMVGRPGYILNVMKALKNVDIDMVTTDEPEISVGFVSSGVDLKDVENKLSPYGRVSFKKGPSQVSIVGYNIGKTPQVLARIFSTLSAYDVSIGRISKSSDYAITVEVPRSKYEISIKALYSNIIAHPDENITIHKFDNNCSY